MKTRIRLLAPLFAAGLVAAACNGDDDTTNGVLPGDDTTTTTAPPEEENGVEDAVEGVDTATTTETMAAALEDEGNHDTLLELAVAAGLAGELQGPGPYTLFAPTDDAFEDALDEEEREALRQPQNQQQLTQVLQFHLMDERITLAQLAQRTTVETMGDQPVQLRVEDGDLYVGPDARVTRSIEASNGVIHVIDGVLVPPGMMLPRVPADDNGNSNGQTGDGTGQGPATGPGMGGAS